MQISFVSNRTGDDLTINIMKPLTKQREARSSHEIPALSSARHPSALPPLLASLENGDACSDESRLGEGLPGASKITAASHAIKLAETVGDLNPRKEQIFQPISIAKASQVDDSVPSSAADREMTDKPPQVSSSEKKLRRRRNNSRDIPTETTNIKIALFSAPVEDGVDVPSSPPLVPQPMPKRGHRLAASSPARALLALSSTTTELLEPVSGGVLDPILRTTPTTKRMDLHRLEDDHINRLDRSNSTGGIPEGKFASRVLSLRDNYNNTPDIQVAASVNKQLPRVIVAPSVLLTPPDRNRSLSVPNYRHSICTNMDEVANEQSVAPPGAGELVSGDSFNFQVVDESKAQLNDRILHQKIQEAKAMNRKDDSEISGAVMHKFSLWSNAKKVVSGAGAGAGGGLGAGEGGIRSAGSSASQSPNTELHGLVRHSSSGSSTDHGDSPQPKQREIAAVVGLAAAGIASLSRSFEDTTSAASKKYTLPPVSGIDNCADSSEIDSIDRLSSSIDIADVGIEKSGGAVGDEEPIASHEVENKAANVFSTPQRRREVSGLASSLRKKVGSAKKVAPGSATPDSPMPAAHIVSTPVHSIPSRHDDADFLDGDSDVEVDCLTFADFSVLEEDGDSICSIEEDEELQMISSSLMSTFPQHRTRSSRSAISEGRSDVVAVESTSLEFNEPIEESSMRSLRHSTTSMPSKSASLSLLSPGTLAADTPTDSSFLRQRNNAKKKAISSSRVVQDDGSGSGSGGTAGVNAHTSKGKTQSSTSGRRGEKSKPVVKAFQSTSRTKLNNAKSTKPITDTDQSDLNQLTWRSRTAQVHPVPTDNADDSPTLSEVSDVEDGSQLSAHNSLKDRIDEIRMSSASAVGSLSESVSGAEPSRVDAAAMGPVDSDGSGGIRWKRGQCIGEGTFGKVYKGLNERTGELLAVKQLYLTDGSVEEVQSLRKEINLISDLDHENIVRYLGTSQSDRYLFILLEFVPGGSIANMLTQFGAFSEDLIRRFCSQILSGVEYLHDKGIIHRDIKGANVLVTDSGVAKLADFGCSKQLVGMCTASLEESLRAIRGSVPWMAPEVIKQTGHGRSSDIWSVGATVIEMATGFPPWPEYNNNLAALFHVATSSEPPPTPSNLSLHCGQFLSRCLVIEAKDRFSAKELRLDPFITAESTKRGSSVLASGAKEAKPSLQEIGIGTVSVTTTPRLTSSVKSKASTGSAVAAVRSQRIASSMGSEQISTVKKKTKEDRSKVIPAGGEDR